LTWRLTLGEGEGKLGLAALMLPGAPPRRAMAHPQKAPLRPLTPEERALLPQIARSESEPAGRVARAKALLAVAAGAAFTAAAHTAGRRSGDGVALLVARFNRQGLAAVERQKGGGPPKQYAGPEAERILREARRPPDRERDGTATWSLTTLQRALRTAPDGLPAVSTFTLFCTLHAAGFSWQESRTWCATGTALRKRKDGGVKVTDPDASQKRASSSKRIE
jgi:transposase